MKVKNLRFIEPGLKLEVFNLFIESSRSVLKSVERQLGSAGLSTGKFLVLAILANEGRTTASRLAKRTVTGPNNITLIIDKMQNEGLVETQRNPDDRRVVYINITPEGSRLLKSAMPVARQTVDKILAGVCNSDLKKLEKILKVLIQNSKLEPA